MAIVWCIRSGRGKKAEELFLKKDVIAIGWNKMGDLSKLINREDFKNKYLEVYPRESSNSIKNRAGTLFRFVNELHQGDYVVLPMEDSYYIGNVVGDYAYIQNEELPTKDSSFPHQRKVKWIKEIPRSDLSQGAKFALGAIQTLFQIGDYSEEILNLLEGVKTSQKEDDSIAFVADEIEKQTSDFILKQLEHNLKGLPLEEFVKQFLEIIGYKVRLTRINEPSIDLIAHKDELGVEPPIIKVQVKSSLNKVDDRDVAALVGKLQPGEFGLLITLGDFSSTALQNASNKNNLRLINGKELIEMILEHYENFESKYRSIIPLKKIYIPQPTED